MFHPLLQTSWTLFVSKQHFLHKHTHTHTHTRAAELSASIKQCGRNLRNSVGTIKVCDTHFVKAKLKRYQGVRVQKWRLWLGKSYLINMCTATLYIKIGLKH
jgi:hypothetical protein